MLYAEFLSGTMQPDNKYTWKEYKRIEQIYNNNNDMTKDEAYRLFRYPDKFTMDLLEDIAELKSCDTQKGILLAQLEKEIETLKQTIESQERCIRSFHTTREQVLKEVEICKQHISNIYWG